jgi:hypothetical protein
MPIIGLAVNSSSNEMVVARADHSVTTRALSGEVTQASSTSSQNAKAACPVTKPVAPVYVPPAPYPKLAPYGEFWYGTSSLWTMLHPEGTWHDLPDTGGYSQKVFWWRNGYVASAEPQPALKLTAKQLDGTATFASDHATNAIHKDFGGAAMLTGVLLPTAGCWEITGEYRGQTLSFVVQVMP